MITYNDITLTEPDGAEESVNLSEVRPWCNIDSDDDDSLLEGMITGARQDIEKITNQALVTKTVEVYFDCTRESDIIKLPYGAISSLNVYSLESTTETAMTLGVGYTVRGNSIACLSGGCFKATYTVGNNVPQALKEAVMMLVAYRYNNRGDGDKQQGIPEDVAVRISKYVLVWL